MLRTGFRTALAMLVASWCVRMHRKRRRSGGETALKAVRCAGSVKAVGGWCMANIIRMEDGKIGLAPDIARLCPGIQKFRDEICGSIDCGDGDLGNDGFETRLSLLQSGLRMGDFAERCSCWRIAPERQLRILMEIGSEDAILESDFISGMRDAFGLDDDGCRILCCTYVRTRHPELYAELLNMIRHDNAIARNPVESTLTGMDAPTMDDRVGELCMKGVIHRNSSGETSIPDSLARVAQRHSEIPVIDVFCESMPEIRCHESIKDKGNCGHAANLLKTEGKSVNIMLYGAPYSVLRIVAWEIARISGKNAFVIKDKDEGYGEIMSPATGMSICRNKNAVAVIPHGRDPIGIATLRNMGSGMIAEMDNPDARNIWIINQSKDILDDRFGQRLDFGFCPKMSDNEKRMNMWAYLSCKHSLPLSEDDLSYLSRHANADYDAAQRCFGMISKFDGGYVRDNIRECVMRTLGFLREIPGKEERRDRKRPETGDRTVSRNEVRDFGIAMHSDDDGKPYDERAVCTVDDPSVVAGRLKILYGKLLKTPEKGLGCVLFHGPPGTGKTLFARRLLKGMELDAITCKVSDIVGVWTGETEANIASLFRKAEKDNLAITIDEVDAFLFDRSKAMRYYEQQMVDEFLCQLENFSGLCICTSNSLDNMDKAALRRFTLKVGFRDADPDQNELLYRLILAPLVDCDVPQDVIETLRKQKSLAPGDFRNVRTMFWLDGNPGHGRMLEALLREQELKQSGQCRTVRGFKA